MLILETYQSRKKAESRQELQLISIDSLLLQGIPTYLVLLIASVGCKQVLIDLSHSLNSDVPIYPNSKS